MKFLFNILLIIFIECEICSNEMKESSNGEMIKNPPSRVWSQECYPYKGMTTMIPYRMEIDSFQYLGKLKVKASDSYPFFQYDSSFYQNVNNYLCIPKIFQNLVFGFDFIPAFRPPEKTAYIQ